jgi:YbbR domain-containing protein
VKAALRWIATNLPLAVLSLILATVAWTVAVEESDPLHTERYLQAIPVGTAGRPDGMFIVGGVNDRVQVTVRAPESVWSSLRLEDFEAWVDLTGIEAGTHELPVVVTLKKQPADVLLIEPRTITLELQPWVERAVPIELDVEGVPALAYLTHTLTMTPTQVMVSGPSSYVDQVASVSARVSIQNASADVNEELSLAILDAQGQSVPLVTLDTEVVRVHVPIELREDFRTLTIKPIREGLVAPGYTITGFSVDPAEVTVAGAPEVVAALPGFIETEAISVAGAESNVVALPALNVPPNVALLPGQQITVTFLVEAIESSLTIEITPTLEGLAPGLVATVSPETVEVFLTGPLPELENMAPTDVRVVLDLYDLEPDTYQLAPQVVVPGGVTKFSILPAVVQVEVSIAPTATPTPTAGPTPTATPTPAITPTAAVTPTLSLTPTPAGDNG